MPNREPLDKKMIIDKIKKGETTGKEKLMIREETRLEILKRKKALVKTFRKLIRITDPSGDISGSIVIKNPSSTTTFASIRCKPESNNSLNLHNLWVGKEDYTPYTTHLLRRLGVGELLLDEAIKYAKEKRYSSITLECDAEDLRFYQKFGFIIEHITRRKDAQEEYSLHLDLF